MGRLLVGVAIAGAGIAALALAGCGEDSAEEKVRLAESQVADAQEELADARAELTSKIDAFCDGSASYITALDRYGDVLTQTAPTVGDVTDAGAELAKPRENVIADAEEALDAQAQVTEAEKELAEANAALAAAKAEAAGQSPTPVPPSPTPTPAPLAPEATVTRVKQADADFTAAREEITPGTPLTQATQRFNAAAVALEMSWLRLFADAGCLTDDQQKQAEAAVRAYTTALQNSLADAGYYKGKVDGVYGPETVAAVEALQKAHRLPVTGTVDKATDAALRDDLAAKGGAAAQAATVSTAALQQTLKLAGYWDGPVDGAWTPALTEALKSFQEALGVKPSGAVDAATIAAFEDALAEARKPPASPAASPSS